LALGFVLTVLEGKLEMFVLATTPRDEVTGLLTDAIMMPV